MISREDHDRRVTELLEANNALVSEKRAMQASLDAANEAARASFLALSEVRNERDEYLAVFDAQQQRMIEAVELWRAEKRDERAGVWPDLGALLAWLMRRNDRDKRQTVVYGWGLRAFGPEQMASRAQRGLRMAEEAFELAQACGCDLAQLHALADYVYSRPVGDLRAEIGGVSVTVLALAECCGVDADSAERAEVERILAKPVEHFTRRNQEKNDAGFLAGAAR